MTMRTLLVILLAGLTGCATLRDNSGVAANPLVQGGISIASRDQCAAFAAGHPDDAKATADYLRALGAAVSGCLGGLQPTP
jgi:hypothetical protein